MFLFDLLLYAYTTLGFDVLLPTRTVSPLFSEGLVQGKLREKGIYWCYIHGLDRDSILLWKPAIFHLIISSVHIVSPLTLLLFLFLLSFALYFSCPQFIFFSFVFIRK
ncbi:hypothetical protein ABZP36_024179 [Zizania latifolia]